MMRADFPRRRRLAAFTLIELLVTISLIAMLAALALVAMRYANTVSRREKTKVHLKAIESGISKYVTDNGIIPRPKEGGEGQTVTVGGKNYPGGGAIALYQALSGDGDNLIEGGETGSLGQLKSTADAKVYWPDLDPRTNPQRIVQQQSGQYMLVDPWGVPWQYRVPPPPDPNNPDTLDKAKYHNPTTYDLWSFADDIGNEKAWIKNW
jgi:prepilin-type N-terminal cleavage/methylation domain-containing protein